MGADLSALLAVGGAVDGGDILSQKMSIGGPDDRVGLLNGALNKIFGKPSGIAGHGKCPSHAQEQQSLTKPQASSMKVTHLPPERTSISTATTSPSSPSSSSSFTSRL